MLNTPTPPRTRKPRGPGRLSPQHLDYLRYRQAGKTQKEAAKAANVSIAKAKRAEKHPDGIRYLADVTANARIEGHYGLVEAVKEVDKAIDFAYQKENPNAIAKLLEHKSKLYGLLVEKVDIKTTYIDLKGALEQAKQRVLLQLNTGDRGILPQSIAATIPAQQHNNSSSTGSNATATQRDHTAQTDESRSMDNNDSSECLHQNSTSITDVMQADSVGNEENQQVAETSSDKLVYVNSQNDAAEPKPHD